MYVYRYSVDIFVPLMDIKHRFTLIFFVNAWLKNVPFLILTRPQFDECIFDTPTNVTHIPTYIHGGLYIDTHHTDWHRRAQILLLHRSIYLLLTAPVDTIYFLLTKLMDYNNYTLSEVAMYFKSF